MVSTKWWIWQLQLETWRKQKSLRTNFLSIQENRRFIIAKRALSQEKANFKKIEKLYVFSLALALTTLWLHSSLDDGSPHSQSRALVPGCRSCRLIHKLLCLSLLSVGGYLKDWGQVLAFLLPDKEFPQRGKEASIAPKHSKVRKKKNMQPSGTKNCCWDT